MHGSIRCPSKRQSGERGTGRSRRGGRWVWRPPRQQMQRRGEPSSSFFPDVAGFFFNRKNVFLLVSIGVMISLGASQAVRAQRNGELGMAKERATERFENSFEGIRNLSKRENSPKVVDSQTSVPDKRGMTKKTEHERGADGEREKEVGRHIKLLHSYPQGGKLWE